MAILRYQLLCDTQVAISNHPTLTHSAQMCLEGEDCRVTHIAYEEKTCKFRHQHRNILCTSTEAQDQVQDTKEVLQHRLHNQLARSHPPVSSCLTACQANRVETIVTNSTPPNTDTKSKGLRHQARVGGFIPDCSELAWQG